MSRWWETALCAQTDPEAFFPERDGDNGKAAKQVCNSCPARPECLEDALATSDPHGVRGGLTAHERTRLLRTTRRAS